MAATHQSKTKMKEVQKCDFGRIGEEFCVCVYETHQSVTAPTTCCVFPAKHETCGLSRSAYLS